MTFIDVCSGIGGGRLGLETNGFKCLGYSDIDKEAIKTYNTFYDCKDEIVLGDLIKINAKNLPKFDLLISGFPCQSFSIVGKREVLNAVKKGEIIFYLVKILEAKQPKFFIFENVKGLINHDKGITIKIILDLLNKAGYTVKYEVLNSLNFDLAQSRERVYFVGIRKDLDMKFEFDEFDNLFAPKLPNLRDFLTPTKENIFDENSPSYKTFLNYLENKYNKGKFDLSQILNQNYLVIDTRQSDLRLYQNKIPTIRRDRQGLFYVFDKNLYKLSAIEALRLQGFGIIPNLESKIMNLKSSDIFRQCGNAMSVNVVSYLAKKLKDLNG